MNKDRHFLIKIGRRASLNTNWFKPQLLTMNILHYVSDSSCYLWDKSVSHIITWNRRRKQNNLNLIMLSCIMEYK